MNQIVQMPAVQYHADADGPRLSNSIAQILVTQSPLHAWMAHPKLNPDYKPKEESRFELGTAAHDLILEGGTPRICVINPEDYRSKPTKAEPEGSIPKGWTNNAIREARDQARANGLTPILPWDNAAIRAMKEVAMKFIAGSELKGIFDNGKPEQTIIWESDGVACRSRLDWLTNDHRVILDYKTAANANPEAFTRQIGAMGYDMQACFYARAVSAACNIDPAFVFLVQEIEPPYACSLVGLSNAYYELAEAKVDRAIALWRECLESGKWPAYPDRVAYAEPPAWALNEHMAMMEQLESEKA